MAQHPLFDQIPELRKDIAVPDFCCLHDTDDDDGGDGDGESSEVVCLRSVIAAACECHDWIPPIGGSVDAAVQVRVNAWFGAKTTSNLHHDPDHNLLCQVRGAVEMVDGSFGRRCTGPGMRKPV